MSEKKSGFFKRLFKFGKKGREEEEKIEAVEAQAVADLEAQQTAEAEKQAEEARAKVAAEIKAAEEEAARQAVLAEQAAEAEKAAEKLAAEEVAAEKAQIAAEEKAKAESARLKAQEEAAAAKAEEAKQAAKIAAEEKDKEQAAKVKREADEALAKAKENKRLAEEAKREAAHRKELRAAEEAEKARLKAEREEAEKLAAEAEAAAQEELEKQAQAERDEQSRLEKEIAQQKVEEAERLAAEAEAINVSEPEAVSPTPEDDVPSGDTAERKKSWFSRLKKGLSRSSGQLTENITSVFTKRKLDEDTLQDLEDILLQADLGVETAVNITDALASQRMGKDITDEEVREFLADEVEKVLDPVAAELELDLEHTPHVILVVGVNGSGKTTTIGKLGQKLYDAGFSTLLVAGDTFRAAAIEQLKIWGDRTQSPVVSRPLGSDAAGLAYDAYSRALDEGRDVMLMDTAGRLQNKTELMDELEKIIRVLRKQDPTAPHTVLLTLDATTGQNAMSQVEIFKDVAGVNGLVMTKLDGTARGGIMVAIASKFKLPVYFVGVGEQVEDLEPFEARDFARSIAGFSD